MSTSVQVKIRIKDDCGDLPIPRYATDGSSGVDLYADTKSPLSIRPGEIKLVSAGIYLSIPIGFEAQIRPRSGLALKHGIALVNSPGTIDSDYRGLIQIIIINLGQDIFVIKRGDRIAQMVIQKVERADFVVSADLDQTLRAHGGFGHTGI